MKVQADQGRTCGKVLRERRSVCGE